MFYNKYGPTDGWRRAARMSRFAQLREDQRNFGGRERAPAGVVEMRQPGIEVQPRAQLVPG